MANKKFSEFTLKTDSANVDFVVGYDGTDNVRIAPSNLGGGGASSLNGLSDVSVDLTNDSAYFINIPSGLSSANGNLIIGEDAGNSIVSAGKNIAIGFGAFKQSSDNARGSNVAIGYEAFGEATSQVSNSVAIGYRAGYTSTNGANAVLIGYRAGEDDQSFGQTGIGYQGLFSSNGSQATGIGYEAGMHANGTEIIAIGKTAGRNLDGNYSIAIGSNAAQSNDAVGHISLGYQAGYSNTSGAGNTNVGYQAGYSNTTGGSRTTVGYEAGKFHTGTLSTFLGYQAGLGVSGSSVGTQNTGIGRTALTALTSGAYNTALGAAAGNAISSGTSNVVIGRSSAGSLNTGSNNIVIGHNANVSSGSVDNEITLGDANIATLRCQVQTISALSDSRDKTNVQPSPYGLDLISQLQPVTFHWNMRDGAKVGQKDLGFIAQELQEVDDENLQLVYDNNPDRLEASYGRLIPVLVQAIKELKAEVELLKA